MQKYFGDWKTYVDVLNDWGATGYYGDGTVRDDFPKDEEIIFAQYDTPSYEGYAQMFFKRDGKLWYVQDSHCSCRGLENFDPEESSVAEMKLRKDVWPELPPEVIKVLEALE